MRAEGVIVLSKDMYMCVGGGKFVRHGGCGIRHEESTSDDRTKDRRTKVSELSFSSEGPYPTKVSATTSEG